MLLELYDFGIETRSLHLIAGALIGLLFGISAQISRFCIRRAVAGPETERAPAGAVWLTALITSILAFATAQYFGFLTLDDHRLMSSNLPVLAILVGGLMFGAGMVLTRGCVSRLTVLSATGNLRAASVLVWFAIIAHATLKGVFAPLRVAIGSVTVPTPITTLAELPIIAGLLVASLIAGLFVLIRRSSPSKLHLGLGALIGLLPVLGWATTSVLLFDEFDPLPVQSAAFTLPWSDTLFWVIASSAVPAGLGVGFIGGTILGSFISALARRELQFASFESPAQMGRYFVGAGFMGMGGVFAGGCTIGAGLSGGAALSIAALLALSAIIAGAYVMSALLGRRPSLAVAV